MRFLLFVVLLAVTSNALGEDRILTPAETLGCHITVPVYVVVSGDKPEWLNKDTLRAYITKRLEGAKIPTKPHENTICSLVLTIQAMDAGPVTAFSIRLGFKQAAMLLDSQIAIAETWFAIRIGTVTPGKENVIRDSVSGMVDEFIAAWDKTHKRPTPPIPPTKPPASSR